MTELPPEPEPVAVMVLRAEGDGCWREHGTFSVPGDLPDGERCRAALDAAADAESGGVPDEGVTYVAVPGWLPVTVRQTMQPQRVFEGL